MTPALRRAALVLHALSQRDRAWLLEQLTPPERARLEPLLAELRGLGIPADRALLDEAVSAARPPSAPAKVDPAGLEAITVLRNADPERIAAVLQQEPPRLVARLLQVADWPWRRVVLRRLGAPMRRRIEWAARDLDGPPGEALRRNLLDVVIGRLAK